MSRPAGPDPSALSDPSDPSTGAGGSSAGHGASSAAPGPSSTDPTGAGRTPWQHYIDLIRALDAERMAEETRTTGRRQGAEAAALEVERLAPLLIDQGAELSHLARRLGVHAPKLTAEPPGPDAAGTGPYDLVVQATRLTARAGSYAREAHQLATRPRFLPGAPPGLRNGLLYLAWALAGLLVQLIVLTRNQGASPVLVMMLIPLFTFVAGLVSVATLARAPLAVDKAAGRSVRVGLLICFGMFPVVMIVYLLRHLAG